MAVLPPCGTPGLVAALLAISLITKPQAMPLRRAVAAGTWRTQGWRGTIRAAVIGAVMAATWLPFVAAGGP